MGRKVQYTKLDRILSKLYRDLGVEEVNETDAVEWAGEALEAIGTVSLYEEAVAFIEVKDHKAELPVGLHSIIQLAKNNRWVKESKNLCPANIMLDCSTEEMNNIDSEKSPCGCIDDTLTYNDFVPLDCNGKIIGDYEVAYYRPYFDLKYEYHLWGESHYYKEHYSPIRLSNHSFFGTLVCEEDKNLYTERGKEDEYNIIDNQIRLSFQEGSIALAYYKQKIDPETGYPMIPDDYSTITAITMYITMKMMARMWYMGREGFSDKMQKAEQDWQWYCKQAANKHFLPYGRDQFQNFTDSRNQLMPNTNKYYGYFGNIRK